MAKNNENLQTKVEQAIDQYNESGNLDVFKDFVGKIQGIEPYGEYEVGDAINKGDWETVRSLLHKLTNFDDTLMDDQIWDIDAKEAAETDNKNIKKLKETYLKKQIEKAAKVAEDKPIEGSGGLFKKESIKPGVMEAKRDLVKWNAELNNLASDDDVKYAKEKGELAKKAKADYNAEMAKTQGQNQTQSQPVNASEKNTEETMEISKKDLNKIMVAMKTINKHFAEEAAEDQVENEEVESQVEDTAAEDTTDEDEGSEKMTVVKLPDDVADSIRSALDKAEEVEADEIPEDDEDDDVAEEEDDNESELYAASEESDFCGDGDCEEEDFCGDDNEELYKFSEAVTQTIENLNRKANKLAGKMDEDANKFVTEFSMKEFRQFAESVTETLEAISARVDALAAKTNKAEITKNLDNLKQTGDDMEEKFITKANETPAVDGVVQNPEASAEAAAASVTFSETNTDNYDYNATKAFLNLND